MNRAATAAANLALVGVLLVAVAGCVVGSGKVARTDELGPLPDGVTIAYETTMGCREGESGFDYRFVVLRGATDLTSSGPLPRALNRNGFYHSEDWTGDLPWITTAYQHERDEDGTSYPLRVEIGPLGRYLAAAESHQGPDPGSLPAEVRDNPDDYVLLAMRPTDFLCSSPL